MHQKLQSSRTFQFPPACDFGNAMVQHISNKNSSPRTSFRCRQNQINFKQKRLDAYIKEVSNCNIITSQLSKAFSYLPTREIQILTSPHRILQNLTERVASKKETHREKGPTALSGLPLSKMDDTIILWTCTYWHLLNTNRTPNSFPSPHTVQPLNQGTPELWLEELKWCTVPSETRTATCPPHSPPHPAMMHCSHMLSEHTRWDVWEQYSNKML